MNPVARSLDSDTQKMIEEYLEKGGTITKYGKTERNVEIEPKNYYSKKKKD